MVGLQKTLDPCFKKYTSYHRYTAELREMMVGITYDSQFQQKAADFSLCLVETDKKALVGQSYVFVGLSPVDGRFVTN